MLKKTELRASARKVLEMQGYLVTEIKSAGVVSGARLKIFKGNESKKVAVRASNDRTVQFSRRPDGEWTTLTTVAEVIVSTPAADDTGAVEVLCFAAPVLMAALEDASAKKPNARGPVIIALDEPTTGVATELKAKAKWIQTLASDSIPRTSIGPASLETIPMFIERVKREFAALQDLDVAKVSVEFRILG